MARKNRYIKTSNCTYCGKLTQGLPFCSSCSKKYFNFDKDFNINDFMDALKKEYPKDWFKHEKVKRNSRHYREWWLNEREINKYKNNPYSKPKNRLSETTSEYADRVDKILNGNKKNQAFLEPSFISSNTHFERKEWSDRRERLYKKWSDRRK